MLFQREGPYVLRWARSSLAPGPATRSSEGPGHWTPEKINVHGKREGVLYLRDKNLDVFFITLNKSGKHFSPSTMYNDYAISERL